MTDFAISIHDITAAAERIRTGVVRTPCIHAERLSKSLDCQAHFKAENLQHIGAFKARGALNAVLTLDSESAARGVVTHSSGNHAAALARAASIRGIPAHVVMPHNSAKNKIASVRFYGVEPTFCEPNAEAREATANDVRQATGATLIHPYDHPAVMAGQGTVGLEVLQQLETVDTIVAPVGGGGLLSGLLIAVKSQQPSVKVIAAEPEFADDAKRSLESGKIEMPTRYDTVADGLRTPLGENTFPIIHELIDDIVLVSESSILDATRILSEAVHLVAEPSGAVTLAAVKQHKALFAGQRVVMIVSGGNLDFGTCQLGQ